MFGYGRSVSRSVPLAGLVVGQGYPFAEMDGSGVVHRRLGVGVLLWWQHPCWIFQGKRYAHDHQRGMAGGPKRWPLKSSVSDGLDVVRDAVVADDSRDMFSGGGDREMGSGVDADGFAADHNLTAREREVFELMLRGRDAKSIGEGAGHLRQHCEGAYPQHLRQDGRAHASGVHQRHRACDALSR